ncbi:collagen alpha-1(I) chain-like [Accipiter gentilis]|uniref:collagen alpha-1(I) chain-like n=1 Tax=Astur gentilis TaxID=8957 RepID=UPI00210F6811|nr:collagen alpha-1(I) chain-like [Accipiter gentilis]
MERLRFPRLPRLLAAAVIVECCARLCPGLGSGTGSTQSTAIPCTRLGTATGERCQTDPERGAGTGRAPMPEAVGQLRTEAGLLPFPGTPAGTAEPPSPQGSTQAGREGTGPAAWDGTATERPGLPLFAGTTERPSPAPAPAELDTAPTAGSPPGTDPGGNVMVEGATTPQGSPSHSPSSVTVPGIAGRQWGSPSTLPGQSPTGTGLAQRQGSSQGPSSLELWAGEGAGATVPPGDGSPGTHPSIAPATGSPALGMTGTSPFVGGLQRLLSPAGTPQGTWQGLPGPAGGRGSDSRPWRGTDIAWQGPRSAPRPSLPSLGAGGRGGPLASTAQPAVGTGPTSPPATGKGSGLPVPTTTASTPGVTTPSLGVALDPTTGVLGPPDSEGTPEHSHIPPVRTWRPPPMPEQPPTSVAPGSTVAAQSRVPYASAGSPRVPPSPQPTPTGSSAVTLSPTPQPSPGASRGVLGLSPALGTPTAGPSLGHWLPHPSSGGDPAKSPQILGGTVVGVGDAMPWSATAPLSWQPGSSAPPSAPGPTQQPAASQSASPPGLTTTVSITTTAAAAVTTTTTTTAATASPARLRDVGTVTMEPGAAVLQGNTAGLTWGPPSHLPTMVPGPPQQPTDPPGTLNHREGPGSPPAAGDTDLVQPSSSSRRWPDADTPQATLAPATAGRAPRVFIVEDQPPLRRASLLRIPCELVLDMGFVPALQDPGSRERQGLLHSFNRTVAPLFMSVPGFLRLEVTGIREGSVVLEYDALFAAERVQAPGLGELLDGALGSGGNRPGLAVGTAPVLRNVALERPLDPCAVLFACRAGFACVAGADGNATCTSLCHRDYCKNHGICTHPRDREPLCQCPVGSDFWFMGLRCDYRVTQQSLLGMAAGVLLSIVLLGAVVAAVAIRRFKALLMEARADQTRSSYRRFCRLDDVSAQYWSRSWLPSASSLDNPAFSNSEELLHLQILDNGCCSCREDSGITGSAKQPPLPPARPPCRPSFHYDWDTSSSSINDPMVDSGKASDISVSSWPMEPIPWTPFPLLHQLSRQRPHKARRPHSYCEGMELVNLERSWTA